MTKTTAASLLLFVSLLAGCAGAMVDWNDPQSIAGQIQIKRDDFKKLVEFKGPDCSTSIYDRLFIRAWKEDHETVVRYQIYVMDYYDNSRWRFYNSAWDSNGNRLSTTVIARDVGSCSRYGGCSHIEHVGVNVSRKYLEKNKESGVRFKLSGKAGEEVFFIPPGYIKAFLDVAK